MLDQRQRLTASKAPHVHAKSHTRLRHTLVLAEPGTSEKIFIDSVETASWPEVRFDSIDEAVRYAGLRQTGLVVVAGSSFYWIARAVHSCRSVGGFPIAVMVPVITQEQMLLLLGEGANMVMDRTDSAAGMFAKLNGLCKSSFMELEHSVRWLDAGTLRLDMMSRQCLLGHARVKLSKNEFDLLAFLMMHSEETVASNSILTDLWNWKQGGADGANVTRLTISRIRRKLRACARDDDGRSLDKENWIESVRGEGYRFTRPVSEIGQDLSDRHEKSRAKVLQTQIDGVSVLLDGLLAAHTTSDIAETVVQWAVEFSLCDAATFFRFTSNGAGNNRSVLVASAGMSQEWRKAMADGHPIEQGFIGTRTFLRGNSIHLSDMTKVTEKYMMTARLSAAEGIHACVIHPVIVGGAIWGDIGFLNRQTKAIGTMMTRYFRMISRLVALSLTSVLSSTDEEGYEQETQQQLMREDYHDEV